jgi:colanic acid/amylovoran biosynthesis protein
MTHVYVHAFLAGNLGDDLLVRVLCKRYPHTEFVTIASSDYKQRFSDIANMTIYSPEDQQLVKQNHFFKKYFNIDDGFRKKLIKSAKATVHIGGSIFTQHFDDWSEFYFNDSQLCKLSKRLYVIGANFGPYTDDRYLQQYTELFRNYKDICFRDTYSYGLFPNMSNIHWAPDVVFNLDVPVSFKELKQVLISPISLSDRGGKYSIKQYEPSYVSFLANISTEFIKKGYDIKFVSFCKVQNDEEAISQIISKIPEELHSRIHQLNYSNNMNECLNAFAESKYIVGTRFHSIVLGWLYSKKVLPIIYNQKTTRLLEDNDQSFYFNIGELDHADPVKAVEELETKDPVEISEIRRKAAGQFQATDLVLKR